MTDAKFVDLGVTVPQEMKDLIILAAEQQGATITTIVRLMLNREKPFLMTLAYPQGYVDQKERSAS